MSWTPEKVDKLRELWGKGHTASQIAELIGEVTRNAVIGKAHRLNLSGGTQNKTPKSKAVNKSLNHQEKNEKTVRKSRFRSILLDKNFEPENPKSLEELDDKTCRWPIGHPDKEDFHFCGRNPISDFPYCKLHILYAFQPKNPKEELVDKEDEIPKFIEKKIKSA